MFFFLSVIVFHALNFPKRRKTVMIPRTNLKGKILLEMRRKDDIMEENMPSVLTLLLSIGVHTVVSIWFKQQI